METSHALAAALDQLEALLRPQRRIDDETAALLARARERAQALSTGAGDAREAVVLVGLSYVADALSALSLEGDWPAGRVDRLLMEIARVLDVSRESLELELFGRAVRGLILHEFPPRVALEVQLKLLLAFAPVSSASVWRTEPDGTLSCTLGVGTGNATRGVRNVAAETLADPGGQRRTGAWLHGIPVVHWGRPVAAIVVRGRPERRDTLLVFAGEVALAAVPFVEKDLLLERDVAREQALVESGEKRLVRLGFDLHDGVLQDLAALGADVRLLRGQIGRTHSVAEHRELLLGRFDDLEARLVALESELRDLARSLEAPRLLKTPLPKLLRREVDRAAAEAGIVLALDLKGNADVLTESQRIALLRVVQEALANMAQHSRAETGSIAVSVGRAFIRAEISDDGQGFDVERTLVQAAKRGRLGLAGMSERIRLLGGRFDVDSRPGGPTTVTATIPRWRET